MASLEAGEPPKLTVQVDDMSQPTLDPHLTPTTADSNEENSRGRLVVEHIFRISTQGPMTEVEVWRSLDHEFGRSEIWVALSHLRRHGAVRTQENTYLEATCTTTTHSSLSSTQHVEDTNHREDEESKLSKVATARNLTSLSGSVPEEARKLAENCRFEEIEAQWDAQTAKAAMTWVWNISQTLPFGDHVFGLAREGRFEEIEASDAVSATLRAWCYLKSNDWKRRRIERSRSLDDRQARTVAHALDQLYPGLSKRCESVDPNSWLAEVADGVAEDVAFDSQHKLRFDRDAVDLDDLVPKLDRALKRRSETCVRRFLTKHGLLGPPPSPPPVETATPVLVEDEDSGQQLVAALRRAFSSRELPKRIEDLRTELPGTTASQYSARARRSRARGKKRSHSGRAPQLSRRKPPAFEPLTSSMLEALHTANVPWGEIVSRVESGCLVAAADHAPPATSPRAKKPGHLPTPALTIDIDADHTTKHSAPRVAKKIHLPAPAVRKLEVPYASDCEDDSFCGHSNPLDPEAMLRSHEAVLSAMKHQIDKLVQDAKATTSGSPRAHRRCAV